MSTILENYPLLLSMSDVAEVLGISRITARKLVRNNSLPAVKVGNRYKVSKNKLLVYLGEDEENYNALRKEMKI